MLLSRKHRFIFVHLYKTAGTSITKALLPFVAGRPLELYMKCVERFHLPLPIPFKPFPKHASAQTIMEGMGAESYRSFFSFAFVRNPWDWQVSLYTYMKRATDHPQHEFIRGLGGFKAYIAWRCDNEVRLQKDQLCSPDGELLVNQVGRFENLEEDFASICRTIGISTSLPRLNVSNTRPYRDFYDDEDRERVAVAFAEDIAFFGYEF